MAEQNIKKLYRNRVGLEDLTTGTGTEVQTRNGQAVTITKINAANLPFDESMTLAEKVTWLESTYPDIENLMSDLVLQDGINNINADTTLQTSLKDINADTTLQTSLKDINADTSLKNGIKNINADTTLQTSLNNLDVNTTLQNSLNNLDVNTTLQNSLTTLYTTAGLITDIQNAEENADLAKRYGNEAEDTEVEIGTYSAKHYSNKAAAAQAATQTLLDQTLAAYDSFDDRYLGKFTSDPLVDNDGNPLVSGALYFYEDTVTPENSSMKVYSGTKWLAAYASLSGALLSTNNLNDLSDAPTARSNLGLTIGVNVQPYNPNTVIDNNYVHTDENYTVAEKNKLNNIEDGATADQTASEVSFTTTSDLSSTDVNSAIEEVKTIVDEKQATTANVLSATAGASYGAVGTYVLAYTYPPYLATTTIGTTVPGHSLLPAGAYYGSDGTQSVATDQVHALSGTWRCMGYATYPSITLWLRIA